MNYFVTGIGTDVGKTIVSAIMVEALEADYWKPIQCGLPRDTDTVASLVSSDNSNFYEEAHFLDEPASPHQAAYHQGLNLKLTDIALPKTNKDLIIEGAGGIMVPINEQEFMLDLIKKFADRVILVASLYLGSINHSLLSVDILRRHHIKIGGIVFNGPRNKHSESIVKSYSGAAGLLHLEPNSKIDGQTIKKWAQILSKKLPLES